MENPEAPDRVEFVVPNNARMYDYYLGGKDNYAVDRAAATQVLTAVPEMPVMAREGRAVIGRFVEHLVGSRGVRQILDIGSGLPTQDNVHEVAHRVSPDVRVVYVDRDPIVCAHARALLAADPRVGVQQNDLLDPDEILDGPEVERLFDPAEPVAVVAAFVLHLIPDSADPFGALDRIRARLAPGSYLALTHATGDARPDIVGRIAAIYERTDARFAPRSREDVLRFFGDFELEPPGLVNAWPYEQAPLGLDPGIALTGYSGMARKSR